MNRQTAVVPYDSPLKRKQWMLEGLIQEASKSFTAAYTGNTMNSIIYQKMNTSGKEGHTVTFDYDGNLVGKWVKGKETAIGTGETKKKFSSELTVERYRAVVDNGDKFDGVNIGDLSITEHQDSRSKLNDVWIRVKDQAIFDVGQQSATHRIIMDKTFTYDQLADIQNIIKTGRGYTKMDSLTTADIRRPLKPFRLENNMPVWLFVCDSDMITALKKSTGAQDIFKNADVRGNSNRLIQGAMGRIGNLLFVEADTFFGISKDTAVAGDFVSTDGYYQFNKSEVEIAGLRQYTSDDNAFVPKSWTGETVAAPGAKRVSRGLILGAGAFNFGIGKLPDYKWQPSPDFEITSESCMEIWAGVRAVKLDAESGDYNYAKMAGISHGIIAVDLQID